MPLLYIIIPDKEILSYAYSITGSVKTVGNFGANHLRLICVLGNRSVWSNATDRENDRGKIMKRLIVGLVAIFISFASASALADKKVRVFQTADIQASQIGEVDEDTAIFSTAEGAAWLKRTKDRVDGRVMAKVDKADAPYSIWWVIFNNPDGCLGSCGLADLMADGGAAADVAVFNASGAISAAIDQSGEPAVGGVINVDLSVIAGEGAGNGSQDPPMDAPPFFHRKFNKKNGLCAEIHVDINEHEFDGDWVQELTYPENPQAFAVFPPVAKCKGKRHK